MLKNGDLTSTEARFRAERPMCRALPTIPKPSLNPEVEEWVAKGGQIERVVKVVAAKPELSENKQYLRREASRQVQRLAAQAVRAKSERTKAEIMRIMRAHGRPAMISTIAPKIGLSSYSTRDHLDELVQRGQIEVVGKLVNSHLYEVIK